MLQASIVHGTKAATGHRQQVTKRLLDQKARTGNRHHMHMPKVDAKVVGAKAQKKMYGTRCRNQPGLTSRRQEVILSRGGDGIMETNTGNDKGNGQCVKMLDGITHLDEKPTGQAWVCYARQYSSNALVN